MRHWSGTSTGETLEDEVTAAEEAFVRIKVEVGEEEAEGDGVFGRRGCNRRGDGMTSRGYYCVLNETTLGSGTLQVRGALK